VVKAEWIELAQALADAAGAVIRPLFRGELQAEYKEARSPIVTVADREAERAMRALLMAQVPEHSILGEEFGFHQTGSLYTWVLDPLDGTIAFSTGKPTPFWASSINRCCGNAGWGYGDSPLNG
jgi:myo-inositol-1(or 4)-monophosphatase